jgi:hypothetical protein
MKWRKIGKIFEPDNSIGWMASHAAVPFLDKMDGDGYWLYFTTRNVNNTSIVARAKLSSDLRVTEVNRKPVLTPGGLGMYDENGLTASYGLTLPDKKLLYFVGWNQGSSTPFRNAIGCAVSTDGGNSYQKYSEGPIVDRSPVDPCFVAGTRVMFDENIFKMWYISCVRWEIVDSKPRHWYHLKYATSADGINWRRDGIVAIDFKSPEEYAISQPWVLKEGGKYKMWYSYRGQPSIKTYRIGYAESINGIEWHRMDGEAGIDVSESGWDSQMICYPFVFDHSGERYMLYNGNEYGKTGIGLAVLEQD